MREEEKRKRGGALAREGGRGRKGKRTDWLRRPMHERRSVQRQANSSREQQCSSGLRHSPAMMSIVADASMRQLSRMIDAARCTAIS